MFEVYDADNGEVIFNFPINTNISTVTRRASSSLRVNEDSLFLLNSSGEMCLKNTQAANYTTSSDPLLLFRKGEINLKFPVLKQDWKDFTDFPRFDWYSEPFNFEIYKINSVHTSILTFDKLLFDLLQNSRESYAKFVTIQEFLSKSCTAVKVRIMASQALINSCKIYFEDVKTQIARALKEIIEFKDVIQGSINDFNSRQSQDILQSIEIFTDIFKESKFFKFGNTLLEKITKIETKINNLEEKYFNNIGKKIDDIDISFEKARDAAYLTLDQLQSCNSKDQVGLILENFWVCTLYEKFRKDLDRLTDPNFHPKTEVYERVLGMGNEIQSFVDTSTSVNNLIMTIEDNEKKMATRINSLTTFYKKYVQHSVSCVNDIKFKIKSKLDKHYKAFHKLQQKSALLQLPTAFRYSVENILHFAKASPNEPLMRTMFNAIYQEYYKHKANQKLFLESFGKFLPKQKFAEIEEVFGANEMELLSRGYRNDDSISLEDSINSIKTESNSKIHEPVASFNIAIDVSRSEIEKFYKKQITEVKAASNRYVEGLNGRIVALEKEIEQNHLEIDSVIMVNKEKLNIITNLCEEIDLLRSRDPEKRLKLKLLMLNSKSKHFVKEKMKLLQEIRDENRVLIYEQSSNSEHTPR